MIDGTSPINKHYLRDFWKFIKPYNRPLRIVYLLYCANALLNLIPAFSIQYYIAFILKEENVKFFDFEVTRYTSLKLSDKIEFTIVFFFVILGIIIVANLIGVLMWRLGTKNVEKVLYDIKIKIHNHINKLSLNYFNSERVGTIMTKAVSDVQNLSMMLKNSFNILYAIIHFLITPILMVLTSPILTLVAIVPLPIIIYSFVIIRIKLRPAYREQRENESELNSQMQEIISGIKEIKAFTMEDRSEKVYSTANWRGYYIQNRIMKIFSFNHQLQYGSKDFGLLLVVVLGGICYLLNYGNVKLEQIISIIALANFMYNPIAGLLGFIDIYQRGMASLERILDFLNIEPDIQDAKNAFDLKHQNIRGEISFDHIAFSYITGSVILDNINFIIKAGEKAAIVGETGSGKSTILSLILRFYNVNQGKIYLDGNDISHYTQKSLRQNIGVVFQDSFLFYGTIRDNLFFANPDKTEEDMIQACQAANIYKDILALPQQFDTLVGERGVKLSGGQRQRLSIARVFLKDPAIVLFDEATSAVDTVTESSIQESINRLLENRTAFIVAHRLSTIKKCDKIIVLKDKSIFEMGTHDELIAKKSVYFSLYNAQQTLNSI